MERLEQMEEYVREFWDEHIRLKEVEIQKKDSQLEYDLKLKIDSLVNEQVVRQQGDNQRIIKYIFLCKLHSSGYTGSYEVVLGMSDDQLFLDENRSYLYWYPSHIYDSLDKGMAEVEKQIKKKFIQVEASELFYLKQRLLSDYWNMLENSFVRISDRIRDYIMDSSLLLDQYFLLLCGNYMDQLRIASRRKIGS